MKNEFSHFKKEVYFFNFETIYHKIINETEFKNLKFLSSKENFAKMKIEKTNPLEKGFDV